MTKGRLEAFSDGAFAIVITIVVPEHGGAKRLVGIAAINSSWMTVKHEAMVARVLGWDRQRSAGTAPCDERRRSHGALPRFRAHRAAIG